ncbi:hypothetical protein AGMMS49940_20790 [Spirochaetia bacterium]|nr:hypothetical protein AGMMS49940_20790 [Spirochaetia bacterium]
MRRLVGILLCILTGCASAPKIPTVEKPLWEQILDEIPWEKRIVGYIAEDENNLPADMFGIMYKYGYQYVNSTHQAERKEGLEIRERIYELDRENAFYDPSDDTFVFIGEFYPDLSKIWLVFSTDENYDLFAGPESLEGEEYRHIRVIGKSEL